MSTGTSINANLITVVPYVGEQKAQLLGKLGINTIEDLLWHVPTGYRDTRQLHSITQVYDLGHGVIEATLTGLTQYHTRRRMYITRGTVDDGETTATILWFNQPYLKKVLHIDHRYLFDVKVSKRDRSLICKSYESLQNGQQMQIGTIAAKYALTAGITTKWLQQRIKWVLDNIEIQSRFEPLLRQEKLPNLSQAFRMIHNPANYEEIKQARKRLAYEEMMNIASKSIQIKQKLNNRKSYQIPAPRPLYHKFLADLPFELTKAQHSVIKQIQTDISQDIPTNRLINGDVGSGKTVIAAFAILATISAGLDAIFLAPTTILADQHYQSLRKLLKPFDIDVILHTSSTKPMTDGKAPGLTVGTHALLYTKRQTDSKIGLVVIDEQHRFGVKQRTALANYQNADGKYPHYISLSATPIPRTLLNIMYSHMQISVLDELPPGRQPVISKLIPPTKLADAYRWIHTKVKDEDAQAFIIYPKIGETSDDNIGKQSLTEGYENLSKTAFSDLRTGMVHGKMSDDEKNEILRQFKKGDIDVLFATTVIEVGIDIPKATIILIHDAENFGLAQLHQLRGRVGRGADQAFCFVVPSSNVEKDSPAHKRLKYFVAHPSGFDVASYDLKQRGPGEVYGSKQSGIPDLKVAKLTDTVLFDKCIKFLQN